MPSELQYLLVRLTYSVPGRSGGKSLGRKTYSLWGKIRLGNTLTNITQHKQNSTQICGIWRDSSTDTEGVCLCNCATTHNCLWKTMVGGFHLRLGARVCVIPKGRPLFISSFWDVMYSVSQTWGFTNSSRVRNSFLIIHLHGRDV